MRRSMAGRLGNVDSFLHCTVAPVLISASLTAASYYFLIMIRLRVPDRRR